MTDFYEKTWYGISDFQHTNAEVAVKLDELDAYEPAEESDKIMFLLKFPDDEGWRFVGAAHYKCHGKNEDGSECNERWAVVGSTTIHCPYHGSSDE